MTKIRRKNTNGVSQVFGHNPFDQRDDSWVNTYVKEVEKMDSAHYMPKKGHASEPCSTAKPESSFNYQQVLKATAKYLGLI